MELNQIVEIGLMTFVCAVFIVLLVDWVRQDRTHSTGEGWIEEIKRSRSK